MTEPIPESERLAKRLARQMACSRRVAEQYIENGWVRVDGQVVEAPMARVAEAQRVELDADASLLALPPVTLLQHKPAGVPAHAALEGAAVSPAQALLTAAHRSTIDRSGTRVLQKHFSQLTLCTPIDTGASGLVVWTQDWRVARKLAEDAALVEHELTIEVEGEVSAEALQRLSRPVVDRGRVAVSAKVSVASHNTSSGRTGLRFAVKGLRPGQIALLCDAAGLVIVAARRLRVGRVPMQPMAPGEWRYLGDHERF